MNKATFHRTVFVVGVGGALLLLGGAHLLRRREADEDPGYQKGLAAYVASLSQDVADAERDAELGVTPAQAEPVTRESRTQETQEARRALAAETLLGAWRLAPDSTRAEEPSVWT